MEKFEKSVAYAPYRQVSTLRLVTDLPVVNQLKPLLKVEKFEKFVVVYAPYPQVSTLRLVTDLPVVNQLKPLLKVEKFEKFVAYEPENKEGETGDNRKDRSILKVEKLVYRS